MMTKKVRGMRRAASGCPSSARRRANTEETAAATVAAEALFDVRHLAKRLRQLRGVQLPIRPQSPIIVALLTFSSRSDARALPGLTTLEGDFPEYPGGIRIELPIDATGFDLTRYAASLERMIMEEA